MSTGAVFQLLTNDGKADKLLLATACLKQRICRISFQRNKMNAASKLPSIKEIEQTHIVWFHNRFKPIVAVAFEYQKVKQKGGTTNLTGSSSVDFEVNMFGEFYMDVAAYIELSTASQDSYTLPTITQPASTDAGGVADAPVTTDAAVTITNATIHFGEQDLDYVGTYSSGVTNFIRRVRYLRYMDEYGNTLLPGSSVAGKVMYAEFPGELIMNTTKFDVLGNPIDQYNTYSYVWYRKHFLTADKYAAYCRCVGQETDVTGFTMNVATGVRMTQTIRNGFQTGKTQQPEMKLWMPLLFWFCSGAQNAFASAPIPQGKRFEIIFGDQANILFSAPCCWREDMLITDYYANATVSFASGVATIAKAADAKINGGDAASGPKTVRQVIRTPIYSTGTINYPTIKSVTLYVNNLFTLPEIHDIYVARTGFQLIRIHRIQEVSINTSTIDQLMPQFKYPVEYVACGLIPTINNNHSTVNCATDWHMFCYIQHHSDAMHVADLPLASAAAGTAVPVSYSNCSTTVNWGEQTKLIETMGVSAQGVQLYDANLPSEFYNNYIPFKYSKGIIVSPNDVGAFLIPFCLFPGIDALSGHINTSRAREFYLQATCPLVGTSIISTQLKAEAIALNFLLSCDGTSILRYST